MPRNRVFISYSHQDEAFLQAFRVHLKPWEDRELLETWSDHQINTSQDWHQAIQAALQETAVAVQGHLVFGHRVAQREENE